MQNIPAVNRGSSINDEEQALLYDRTPTPLCRICYESNGILLSACDCSGTQGLVHRKCLRQWVLHYALDKHHCEICNSKWKIDIYSPTEKCYLKFKIAVVLSTFYMNIVFTLALFDSTVRMPLTFSCFYVWICSYGIMCLLNILNVHRYVTLAKLTSTSLWFVSLFVYCIQSESYTDRNWKKIERANVRWDYETYNEQLWFITLIDILHWLVKFSVLQIRILLSRDEDL